MFKIEAGASPVRMNFGSKSKKGMVLSPRPDPPTVEQIMEDVNRACPSDPVFTVSHDSAEDLKANSSSSSSEVEVRYLRSRRYIELHERLQEERGSLTRRRDELRTAGESLERSVMEVKRSAL